MSEPAAGRRRLAQAAIAGAVLLVVVAVVASQDEPGPAADGDNIPTAAAADELARQSCDYLLGELPIQLAEDAPAEDVLGGIRRAERLARTAADRDPRWVSLVGGAGALRESLEEDDPGAASVAVRVIRTSCEPFQPDDGT